MLIPMTTMLFTMTATFIIEIDNSDFVSDGNDANDDSVTQDDNKHDDYDRDNRDIPLPYLSQVVLRRRWPPIRPNLR